MHDLSYWMVVTVMVMGYTGLVYAFSWASGHKRGVKDGFRLYVSRLKFERREETLLEPSDQPHSARPRGRARVTEAHMSQSRRYWTDD